MFAGFGDSLTIVLWFGGAAIAFLALLLTIDDKNQLLARLRGQTGGAGEGDGWTGSDGANSLLGPLDRKARRKYLQEEKKRKMRERIMQAGFYGSMSWGLYQGFRILLILGAVGLGVLISTLGEVTLIQGIGIGAGCGVAATIAPGFMLDHMKKRRQTRIRRALPDALDVLVVCLQAGLSLNSALSRLSRELAVAHPMLALEIKIVERQVQLGQSAGQALRAMADRFDLEELRGMASTIKQAERIGASVATAMEVFAETLRLKRQQRAEEQAHKAAIKLLFPTVACILPSLFIVILGPAAIQINEQLLNGAFR
jgi:tight adherence protein C